jgi:hypothetical protein
MDKNINDKGISLKTVGELTRESKMKFDTLMAKKKASLEKMVSDYNSNLIHA